MARSMGKGCTYRPTVTRTRNGAKLKAKSRYYWVRFTDENGQQQQEPLKLPNGLAVTDKGVARELLRAILNRVERRAAGLIDPEVESAGMPVRVLLARLIRDLRNRGRGRRYAEQVIAFCKVIFDKGGITTLAQFQEGNIVKALGTLRGRSPKTIAEYRRSVYLLAEFGVKIARVLGRNPVASVPVPEVRGDVRKVRRAMTVDDAVTLLRVAPDDRRLVYAAALLSGLRMNELRQLRWGDVRDIDGDRPALAPRAATTKAKRADELPLHPDLAEALRHARGPFAKATDRIFATMPTLKTFKADLVRAGLATAAADGGRIETADDRGCTLDRHALRTTFSSWLGAAGVDPRNQTRLDRHSPRGLTQRNYQDVRLLPDLHVEIAKLPAIIRMAAEAEAGELLATGTGGAVALPVALDRCNATVNGRNRCGSNGKLENRAGAGNVELSRKKAGFRPETKLEPKGIEPSTSWLQTMKPADANPLNHSVSEGGADARCTPRCTTTTDPDLESLIRAWPNLPAAVRKVILNLIKAAGEGGAG